MASLQQTPITSRYISPPSTRITASLHPHKPLNRSFSGSFASLRIPKLTTKLTGKPRRLVIRMADNAAESYATALADVATATGTLETTCADLEKLEKLFSDPQICNYFANPTVELESKRQMIDEITSSSKLQPHIANFLNILVDMNRIELFADIVKEFEVKYNKLTDTELAVVTSVVKLESQHLAQIAKGVQKLSGAKNVRIKTEIDPSLVAGFTIRYGGSGSKMIDMSVKKQLDDLVATQLEIGEIELVA